MNQPIDIQRLQNAKLVKSLFISFALCSFFLIFHMAEYMSQGAAGIMGMDFGVFHLVGKMIWHGHLDQAYSVTKLTAIEAKIVGMPGLFMPWAYPPQYNFIPALLALAPTIPAYVAFIVTTYLGYLWSLRSFSPETFPIAMLVLFPTLLIEITCGQNGFLTGILVALFATQILRGSSLAGIPLGLMAIKPHLALGLALFVLIKRRYDVLGLAIATTLVTLGAATLAFGPGIWHAFFAGAREASQNLANAVYPMDRMTSVFAALSSLGLPKQVALGGQAASALLAAGLIYASHRRGDPLRVTLGLACAATLAISPYNYDYDLPIFGIGLALLLPDLLARLTRVEAGLGLALYWIAAGTGFTGSLGKADLQATLHAVTHYVPGITLAGFAYLAVLLLVARALTRRAA